MRAARTALVAAFMAEDWDEYQRQIAVINEWLNGRR